MTRKRAVTDVGPPAARRFGGPAPRRRERAAFTLIELLIVVAILGVLVTILVPVLGEYLNMTRWTKCLTNLRAVGMAITTKGEESGGNRIFGLVHGEGKPNTFAGAHAKEMDDFQALGDTNAMQNAWQMVHGYGVDWRAFLCPGDGGQTDRLKSTTDKFGWTALTEFSYGIQYPYGLCGINDTSLKDRAVIMADRNPGGPVREDRDHSNHPDGVCVLFYDGNVKYFEQDNSKVGYARDEIYTNKNNVPGGPPVNRRDTSITPHPSPGGV